jgi:hypothetical protein
MTRKQNFSEARSNNIVDVLQFRKQGAVTARCRYIGIDITYPII